MTYRVTVPDDEEITSQVTFGSAALHVVYSGALLAGTLCVISTPCPVFCTIPPPVTEVTWKVVTWVESVKAALFACRPPVAVTPSGKLPPGVAVELVRAFLSAEFDGVDRHRRRVEMIEAMESKF